MDYFAEALTLPSDCVVIPITWRATRNYSMKIHGFSQSFTISCNDPTLTEILYIASGMVKAFVNLYKERCVFTEPHLSYSLTQGNFVIDIGTMDKELYQSIKKSLYDKPK